MRRITIVIITCLAAFLLQELPVEAETRYISDQLYVTLRAGKSQEHEIIKTLKTDAPLEILDDSDDKYLRVKTSDGKTGYVLKQYVTKEKPKYMIINRLKKKNENAVRTIGDLKTTINDLENELSSRKEEYRKEVNELSADTDTLEDQLAASRNKLEELKERYNELLQQSGNLEEIVTERNHLRERNTLLSDRIQDLQKRNSELRNLAMLKWFLAGAGVFLLGWLIGKARRRKKMKW